MPYRTQRQTRYYALIQHGLLRFEAQELSGVKFSEAPYIRRLMADRLKIRRAFSEQAKLNKWSTTQIEEEWRKVVRQEYLDHGWIREKSTSTAFRPAYKASPWEMLKEYRQKHVEQNPDWSSPSDQKRKRVWRDESGKPMVIRVSKGDVKSQKRRERERIHAMRGTPDYERYRQRRREQARRARQRERRGK